MGLKLAHPPIIAANAQASANCDDLEKRTGTQADAKGRTAFSRSLLAEARGVVVRRSLLLELGVIRVQAQRAFDQHVLGLAMIRIRDAALDGTHGLAGFVIVET